MVRVALIGAGSIALQNHAPGIATHPEGRLVALCDPDPGALERASQATGITRTYTDYRAVLDQDDIDAVVITTPNHLHAPIATAAVAAGKHVMCEKPIGMTYEEAQGMAEAAERAGVVHMTAFTYRFVPAIRYMKRLVGGGSLGVLYHLRSRRLQDWGDRAVGWRQVKALAGTGEIGDMLSHRIDYAHYLIGPIERLVAQTRQCLAERRRPDGSIEPSDVEDWVALLGELKGGVTGVFESSKMATGRGSGGQAEDFLEINGSGGTLIYYLNRPHEILIGSPGGSLVPTPVPEDCLKVPGSLRDPRAGDPLQGFRYDQSFELIQAIVEGRAASPDFRDGARAQAVMDAVLLSAERRQWVDVPGATIL
jgi:predicted dehydrogenase